MTTSEQGSQVRDSHTLLQREWLVDGVVRQARIYHPAQDRSHLAPVVFAFHGHGSTMAAAAEVFAFHTLWPEAIVVYMQGLNTPGVLFDPHGKLSGWHFVGGSQGDRDLKFFDHVLATLCQEDRVDEKRIYATGHSNGGYFTYLLWAARGDRLAACAPTAASAIPVLARLKPKPVLHIAGRNDLSVKFEWQQRSLDRLCELNECGTGQPWDGGEYCTLYPSKIHAPVVTCIHPDGHGNPPDASAMIVKFFQEN